MIPGDPKRGFERACARQQRQISRCWYLLMRMHDHEPSEVVQSHAHPSLGQSYDSRAVGDLNPSECELSDLDARKDVVKKESQSSNGVQLSSRRLRPSSACLRCVSGIPMANFNEHRHSRM